MKILWLTPNNPENISIGRERIADGLRERGHSVTQVAGNPSHLSGVKMAQFDACIGTTRAGGLFGLGSLAGRVPFIVDHVDPISQFYNTASSWVAKLVDYGERQAFKRANGVLYVYNEERPRVEQYNENVARTHLGVDYDRFANPDTAVCDHMAQILANHGIEPGFTVYIGGLEPMYNIDTLLETREYTNRDIVIVGKGALLDRVEAVANDSTSVHYLGAVPHKVVPGLLEMAGVGVSLVDDPHTVKVLEYGASGLPVVQLDGRARDELPESVVFTNNDPESVARAITDARGTDTRTLETYAQACKWSYAVDDYEAMIQNVA